MELKVVHGAQSCARSLNLFMELKVVHGA